MEYTITYNEKEQKFEMNGALEMWVCNHLYTIAKENNVTTIADSESHHLAILDAHGIKVNLLEEDGSRMEW